jgi:DNA polymerase-3 subunit alpha
MKAKGIKPILGCELYISQQDSQIKTKENSDLSHFILLAKNKAGWFNLIKIISETNKPENFYHKPRISFDRLKGFLDGNLIGFSGHLGSTIADAIQADPDNAIKIGTEHVSYMKDLFGDNYFLESQLMDRESTPEQIELTNIIRRLGSSTNTKIICTPDAHYCEKEDAVDQRILLCNNLKTTLTEINKKMLNNESIPMGCFFKSDNFHILSPEEIALLHTEDEIENTNYVDSLCEDYDILHKPMLPPFSCPNNINPDEYLRELCRKGWKEKIANNIDKEDQQQ